jgi:coenzyme Q-binding protein COQ10
MPKFSEHRVVAYSPLQMFDLVADVGRYPEFLPWCLRADITLATNDRIEAELTIGWKMLRESFFSQIRLQKPNKIIVEYAQGPFRYLHSEWNFTENAQGCAIDFAVDFEFRSPLLRTVMEPLFLPAVHKMIRAFEARAEAIYAV